MTPQTLQQWAEEEIEGLLMALPDDVREAATSLPVSMEEKPGHGPFDHELVGDELGLFEGPPVYEEADPSDLPRIRLFLANIWEWPIAMNRTSAMKSARLFFTNSATTSAGTKTK